MDNNHWSCIKIGFQITQDLDEFSTFVGKDEMPLWFVGGTLLLLHFLLLDFVGVIKKSSCEKEDIHLRLGMKGKDISRRFVALCVLFIYFIFLRFLICK